MKEYSFELVDSLPVHNTLGEGIIWNRADGSAWWSDIQECRIFRYHLASKEIRSWSTPERVGSFGFIENDARLIVAFASGFAYYELESGEVEWIARPESEVPGNRFNDGRVDRQGRFWAGTMVEDDQQSSGLGALYCIESTGELQRRETGIAISNGLCWSPDSRFMYHADSPLNKMYVYDFDANSGVASNRRLFADTDPGCHPDGAIVDADGYILSAQWGGSRLVRYTPEGDIDGILQLPVSQPTCMALGGDNLDLLFVTTATEGLAGKRGATEPQAGNVLIYQTSFKGIDEPQFIIAK